MSLLVMFSPAAPVAANTVLVLPLGVTVNLVYPGGVESRPEAGLTVEDNRYSVTLGLA